MSNALVIQPGADDDRRVAERPEAGDVLLETDGEVEQTGGIVPDDRDFQGATLS